LNQLVPHHVLAFASLDPVAQGRVGGCGMHVQLALHSPIPINVSQKVKIWDDRLRSLGCGCGPLLRRADGKYIGLKFEHIFCPVVT
jgi:hypothetical protein